jgi:hypothetical protein
MSASAGARRPRAPPFVEPPGYARHRPEATLPYRLVEQRYPAFRDLRAEGGRPLPAYVQQEFEAYLKCGRLEEGFLRVRCEQCHAETLVASSCKKRACGQGRLPTGPRRVGAALTATLGTRSGTSGPVGRNSYPRIDLRESLAVGTSAADFGPLEDLKCRARPRPMPPRPGGCAS